MLGFIFVIKTVDNTPMLWLLLNSVCTAPRISLDHALPCPAPLLPLVNGLGVGKRLGWHAAGRADPNWPKHYSIPCNITLIQKSSRKGGGRGDARGYTFCFPKQQLSLQKLFFHFPGSSQHLPADGK